MKPWLLHRLEHLMWSVATALAVYSGVVFTLPQPPTGYPVTVENVTYLDAGAVAEEMHYTTSRMHELENRIDEATGTPEYLHRWADGR